MTLFFIDPLSGRRWFRPFRWAQLGWKGGRLDAIYLCGAYWRRAL